MWPQFRGCALAMDSLSYSKHPAQVAQGNALLKASSQGVQEVKLVSILFHGNDKEHLLARTMCYGESCNLLKSYLPEYI